ncbi:tetratricopeptide repeat protein [Agilicoccus flavus]|uniref:tetratricopeptide repeat protein n=1 Tax=Agilicoccus flavus TaxID=2775968 RepID=UPI001CF66CC5|nr:tetratricopeptide repeat protein [Agilicoccus flavus]
MIEEFDRYTYATRLFDERRHAAAARELEGVVAAADGPGVGDAPLLLARAYYHSAQLARAEAAATALVDRDPTDGHAMLLLARTLQRQGRPERAEPWHRRAQALGVE